VGRRVVVWDAQTKVVRDLQPWDGEILPRAVAITADQKNAVILGLTLKADGEVRANVVLAELATVRTQAFLNLGRLNATSIVLTPDGKTIVVGGGAYDKAGEYGTHLQLWDRETKSLQRTIVVSRERIATPAFSPNGRMIATGDEDGRIRVWEVATGRERFALDAGEEVSSVAFSRSGYFLAAGTASGHVCFWDLRTKKCVEQSRVKGQPVYSLDFAPIGRTIAAATSEGVVLLTLPAAIKKAE
jgi:WD40 repeat protein